MTGLIRIDSGPMNLIWAHGNLARSRGALYLGNIPNAIALGRGMHKNVWAILNCTDDDELDHLNAISGFETKRLNHVDGHEYPAEAIKAGLDFIDLHLSCGESVLVCCHAGISRSAGMVLAYLLKLGYNYNEGIQILRKARPIIQLHPKIDLSIRKYFKLAPRTAADLISG